MLRWFRRHASPLAATMLVALLTVGSASITPHEDDCHDGCLPAAVTHDESAHRLEAATGGADHYELHCVLCHWVRSFRPFGEARVAAPLAATARPAMPAFAGAAVHTSTASQPPLRSPPASAAI